MELEEGECESSGDEEEYSGVEVAALEEEDSSETSGAILTVLQQQLQSKWLLPLVLTLHYSAYHIDQRTWCGRVRTASCTMLSTWREGRRRRRRREIEIKYLGTNSRS